MARLSLIIAVCLAALFCAASALEELQPTSYTQLTPVKGQWTITVEKTAAASDQFSPVTCDQAALTAPCNQPLLSAQNQDKLKVTYKLNGTQLKTADDLAPKNLRFVACYATPSQKDRPWRKFNDVIDKDKSCPFIMKESPLNSTDGTYTVTWPLPKNTTKATWYAQVMVQCQNGTKTSYCQYDSTVNQTFWGTTIINSTPVGLKVATAVAASIGPLFLGAFFVKDFVLSRKKL